MTSWRDQLSAAYSKMPFVNTLMDTFLRSRTDIMTKTGTSFGGNRKNYQIFGWPVNPDYVWFEHFYKRGGVAKRIVDAYPQATWRTAPTIKETESKKGQPDTPFEKDWKLLIEKRKIFHYLNRVDRLARLGRFAVMFIGFNDGAGYDDLNKPVGALKGKTPDEKILYLQPFAENRVSIAQWEADPMNERFGLPLQYLIQLETPLVGQTMIRGYSRSVNVHYTRVLHVAEDVLETDVEGTPVLEGIMNYLVDLEKVHGSAAETFFQQSPPATVFSTAEDSNMDADTLTDVDMKGMVDDFMNGYKRWLMVKGFNVNTVSGQVHDPTNFVNTILDLIGGTTGIPKRILVGSERGQLASSQDETNWNKRIEERQQQWAEPFLLRPLIQRIVDLGVISPPSAEDFLVQWHESQALSEIDSSKVAQTKAGAVAIYASKPDNAKIIPPDIFLEEIMGFSQEVVDRIKDELQVVWDMNTEQLKKDPKTLALEQAQAAVETSKVLGVEPGVAAGFPPKAPPAAGKPPVGTKSAAKKPTLNENQEE